MKICPFISHMIGENSTNVLEVGQSTTATADSGVVILGYDGSNEGSNVATATRKKKKTKSKAKSRKGQEEQSHLFCLKDTCRFYRKKDAACTFDALFEMTDSQAKAAAKAPSGNDKSLARVSRDLDKFWKFQTRSVSELIASIGDAEKNQKETLAGLETSVREALKALSEAAPDDSDPGIRDDLERLNRSIADREESVESFSTTISELIINIEDNMKDLGDRTSGLAESVDKLAPALGGIENIERRVVDAVEEKLEKRPAPDMPVDRSDEILQRIDTLMNSVTESTNDQSNWRNRIDACVDAIAAAQEHQKEELEQLRASQARLLAAVEKRPATSDDTTQSRRREARKLNNLGVRSFHNGDLALAQEQFEQAVDVDPSFAEAWNNLGLVFTETEEKEQATRAFERAIDANPDLHTAYSNLGYVFYSTADYENAARLYGEALDRREDSSSNWANLGNARYHLGDPEGARAAWERAMEIDPENETAADSLARLNA